LGLGITKDGLIALGSPGNSEEGVKMKGGGNRNVHAVPSKGQPTWEKKGGGSKVGTDMFNPQMSKENFPLWDDAKSGG